MGDSFEPCLVDGVRLTAYQNCAISIWQQKPGAEVTGGIAKLNELVEHLASRHAGNVVKVVVITPGNPLPNSAQRKELEAFYARWNWQAVVQVAEGIDLWSVTARSVMTAMRLVQRKAYPNRVFADADEASQWASEYIARGDGQSLADAASGLVKAIESLRSVAL
jgi:hypothetical protein